MKKIISKFRMRIKIMVIFLFCFACLQGHAQYSSFFKNFPIEYSIAFPVTCYTDDYSPDNLGICCLTEQFSINQNDTITIGDYQYYKFSLSCLEVGEDYIREDTNTGRIFRYYPEYQEEKLWCDLSLQIGDTFYFPTDDVYYSEGGQFTVVDSISYYNGKKVIHLRPLTSSLSAFYLISNSEHDYNIALNFIEGIGPSYGPFGYLPITGEHYLGLVLCVTDNDSLIYMRHPDLGCYQANSKISEISNKSWRLYPNPSNAQVHFVLENSNNFSGDLIISDMIGNVVYQRKVQDAHTLIDISLFSEGVYTLLYIGKEGKIVTKFIKIK